MADNSCLKHFPVSWFSMIMGLGGCALAWARTANVLAVSPFIGEGLLVVTGLLFLLLLGMYAAKLLLHPAEVLADFSHPIRMNFVPTVSIALLILSIGLLQPHPYLSRLLWIAGTLLHLGLTFYVMTVWVHHSQFEIAHLNPAWFIPVVGNILVPIAGARHFDHEISWFFFSIGIVFWPVLLAVIFYRLIFHPPLPERLFPTLFILIAPPAVGFISYFALTAEIDIFARILYYTGLFFTLLLAVQTGRFARLKFTLSWWAYSFPLAAITIASLLMYETLGTPMFGLIAIALLAVLNVLIIGLLVRTVIAVIRGEVCVEGA
jgi:tellurite resistance protein